MSGPPHEHQSGKTLLHTRGFGLKILHTSKAFNKPSISSTSNTPTLTNANKVKPISTTLTSKS